MLTFVLNLSEITISIENKIKRKILMNWKLLNTILILVRWVYYNTVV